MRIVIGGQLNEEENARIVRLFGPDVDVMITDDMSAALAVRDKACDYYLGSCQTGGGGALAMPMAILGAGRCVTVAGPGFMRSDEEIEASVAAGAVAFGFVPEAAEAVIPVLLEALRKGER